MSEQKPTAQKGKNRKKISAGESSLDPLGELFCLEYIKDMNATRSYYEVFKPESRGTARVEGSKLLTKPDIQSRINELFQEMATKGKVKAEMIIRELALIAFSDVGVVADWGNDGLDLKPSNELERDERAAISELSVSPVASQGVHVGYEKKFKMHSKVKALETLAKYFGLLDSAATDEQSKKPFALNYDAEKLKAFIEKKESGDAGPSSNT